MAVDELSFQQLVDSHYESLYRFALSLTHREADACDMTQQTFYRWASKGHQLRDKSKAKSWLFTTLHREFLGVRRHEVRFPHLELDQVPEEELTAASPSITGRLDGNTLMQALFQIDELYRAPLLLFYLENNSYREIAEILDVPAGTVMSRLARGKAMLRQIMTREAAPAKIIPLESLKTKDNK